MQEIGQLDIDQNGTLETFYLIDQSQGKDVLMKTNRDGQDYFVRLSPADEDKIYNVAIDAAAGTLAYNYEDRRTSGGKGGGHHYVYHGARMFDRDKLMAIAERQIKHGGIKVDLEAADAVS